MEPVSASSSDEGGANKGVATFMFMDAKGDMVSSCKGYSGAFGV